MGDPIIGRQFGDYVIQDLLGRGGMARVYKGYDARLQRYAAVKVINADLIASADQREYTERFQREARAIAKLNHPNIVGVYQFGEYDEGYYMAMVFIEGQDLRQVLRDYIARGQRMPHDRVLNIVTGTANALDYAHSRGVIHRDIKPSNIMLNVDDQPILTDFGLALSATEGTMGDTFGSAHYIAPEQAVSSAKAVPQSDLYSLGICAYEMFAGRVPFDDPSAMSVALMHLNESPPPLRELAPELPVAIERVVLKTLAKDPAERYPSGAALSHALAVAVMGGETAPLSPKRAFPSYEPAPTTSELRPPIPSPLGNATADSKLHSSAVHPPETPSQVSASQVRPPDDTGGTNPEVYLARSRSAVPVALAVMATVIVVGILAMFAARGMGASPETGTTGAQNAASRTAVAALNTTLATLSISPTVATSTPESATPSPAPIAPSPVVTAESTSVGTVETTPEVTSAATVAVASTETQVPAPLTSTLAPTAQPTDSQTAVPSLTNDSETDLLLLWSDEQFNLINMSGQTLNISSLTLRQTRENLERSFDATLWGIGSSRYRPSAFPAGFCYQINRDDLGQQTPFKECRPLAAYLILSDRGKWFWIAVNQNPTATFEVIYRGQSVQVCSISGGRCSIKLPR